jgi:hypothetical protein
LREKAREKQTVSSDPREIVSYYSAFKRYFLGSFYGGSGAILLR